MYRTLIAAVLMVFPLAALAADDPLPSWNEGAAKTAIIDSVTEVTRESGPDFIPPAERIATFDNDGTLWTEAPLYSQGFFMLDRMRKHGALSPGMG